MNPAGGGSADYDFITHRTTDGRSGGARPCGKGRKGRKSQKSVGGIRWIYPIREFLDGGKKLAMEEREGKRVSFTFHRRCRGRDREQFGGITR